LRFIALLLCAAAGCAAAEFAAKVVDPSDAPVPFARVVFMTRLGIAGETATSPDGAFRLRVPDAPGGRIVITAPGFATASFSHPPALIRLALAPQTDAITVTGSAVQAPLSEQGSSISVIPRAEIERRNEASALDLLRAIPGLAVTQNGERGGVGSVFIRGGNSNFNLVMIDGVPVNRFGGEFDFSTLTSDQFERIEVLRGAQSASHGPYANSGAIHFITRADASQPRLDVLAEGGSHRLRRFGAGAAGTARGFELSANASKLEFDGEVDNQDFRSDVISLGAGRRFGKHMLTARGLFNSAENGVPGPYGSNPAGIFSGLDRISRNWFNWSSYTLQSASDFSPRFRQEFSAALFLNNARYRSPFDESFNRDLRGGGEARSLISVTPRYTLAAGIAYSREQVENTYITDASFRSFPVRRDLTGIYAENRFDVAPRWFLNAGIRAEIIRTARIPANDLSGRPEFAANTTAKANPRISLAYAPRQGTRLRTSLATGIRPPGGFDLAFTDNPALKPERTFSFDAGVEQRLAGNRLGIEATYFYNRYYDLIVSLGGALTRLSNYQSDNLSNARAQGVEFAVRARPLAAVSINAAYTFLDSELLSLDGSSGVAPRYFEVGQWLIRRPRHAASLDAAFSWKRVSANAIAYARGRAFDVEPNFGPSAGLFYNPGYAWLGVNLNVRLARGFTVYGNLRNALNRRYEEIFGYPSPRLNFVSGVKWKLFRD
jgi:outer membrane cobalamin receptor